MVASKVAIVGATGLVGETLLRILEERSFPVSELRLFATSRSAGARATAFGRSHEIVPIDPVLDPDFSAIDVAFFAAGENVSRRFAERLAAAGTLVIDKSAAFRMRSDVPLVVPEVNAPTLSGHKLVANPNCTTIPLAVMLAPIQRRFGLRWVSVSTYQSVSGAGKDALAEYERQQSGDSAPPAALPRRIHGNVIPENGSFDATGYGEEERKIADELRKILADGKLLISATSVRVPVAVGHGEAVAFETNERATREQIAELLNAAAGVRFQDGSGYASPLDIAGSDDVAVGRLRPDTAHPGAYLAWVACDNLRKGAATNAVQIAEIALSAKVGASA